MSSTLELLEMRFKKYLHYASEYPLYRAGDRFHFSCYTQEQVPSLLKLIEEGSANSIMETILTVKKNETSVWPDALIYALATCCMQLTDSQLRKKAYASLRTVCRTSRDILLFTKFCKNIKGDKLGGNGFKRAVAQWYLVWCPFDLANIFLSQRSYHGWSHIDILRLAHVKPISAEQQLLFTYITHGMEKAVERFGENNSEEVVELLEYISTVESFRRIKTAEKAAKALAAELHSIERVPNELLKHQEVWNELIPRMDVQTLLDNLQRLAVLGFLKNNNVTVMKVVDIFNHLHKAEKYKGHPSRVYIELLTYEKAATFSLDIATKLNHPISKVTPARKPPKINLVIRNALSTFFHSLYKYQKATEKRYLVAIDIRAKMFSDRCKNCQFITPSEAAQVISLSLMKTEPDGNVTISAFVDTKGVLQMLKLNKTNDIGDYETALDEHTSKAGPACVAAAIHWAEVNKKPFDVIVVLSNYTVGTKGARAAINQYRTTMNLPNTKVFTCSLTGNLRSHKDVEGLDMMCVIGFDEHICRLLTTFASSAF